MSARTDEGRWTAWLAAWVAIVTASLLAAVTLGQLSAESSEAALDDALAQHLRGEAGAIAEGLRAEPLDAALASGATPGADAVRARLDALRQAGGLHAAALFSPGRSTPVLWAETWVVGKADAALILAAREGAAGLGPLYQTQDGELYRAAYVPVPGHAGWVLGVKGSGATLMAVERMEDLQVAVGVAVVIVAMLIGAVLATAVTRPLHRLDLELAQVSPGDAPESLSVQGPREVRRLAVSARRLLGAIRERDRALQDAHTAQIRQLTALAAAVAHEVRNPLHALGVTLSSLERATEAEKRALLLGRAGARVDEIERIVTRFLDLSRPLSPRVEEVELAALAARVVSDAGLADKVTLSGASAVRRTDPELLGQVLGNLLQNAHEAGASRISITLVADGVVVTDDGPGVSEADAEQLFTWFHTSRAQGTGLGLPQSRRICLALGGGLSLERARPATFRVQLPREPA